MSERNKSRTAGASIPPIEIGSFIALEPDKSEFIGSASGVFFANTVFRAFASATASLQPVAETAGAHPGPSDPGSAHTYLVSPEADQATAADGDDETTVAHIALEADTGAVETISYGLTATGLGAPPSLDSAKELLLMYFRNWHPFFPFLHGPTFFDQVKCFYEKHTADQNGAVQPLSLRSRLLQAVTFQCIFNIAGSAQKNQEYLKPSSRIKSVSSLMNLLGVMSGSHDTSSIQTLLAVELYLLTNMSLRAASTVHGTLTRMLYHSGFHRCPYRFVQLPRELRDIRKRIFWCVYILDRQISQALGHPLAIKDEELDVCIPGMTEFHRPVGPQHSSTTHTTPSEDVRAHLPRTSANWAWPTHDSPLNDGTVPVEDMDLDTQIPAHHHQKTSPQEVGEFVLGYLATYSQLVGQALDLFHQSIHARTITQDKVQDILCRIHSWWNSLPPAIQDNDSNSSSSNPNYGAFFAVAYHYLIIFLNRPFLSLPTDRMDFKSSLQSALGASRSIIIALRAPGECCMLFHWPGILSATWMSGLVVAYAGLLDIYPLEKAVSDIEQCFVLFEKMSSGWASARHCHAALQTLHRRLQLHFTPGQPHTRRLEQSLAGVTSVSMHPTVVDDSGRTQSNKRQKTSANSETLPQSQSRAQVRSQFRSDVLEPQIWQPVLEYTGPDFGFGSNQIADRGEWQGLLNDNFNAESGGLFDIAGWEAYVQTFDDRLNFGNTL